MTPSPIAWEGISFSKRASIASITSSTSIVICSMSTGRLWQGARTAWTSFSRANSSRRPSRLMTTMPSRTRVSVVVNLWPHSRHSRRRRIVLPSLLMRESITLSSMEVHLGQRMVGGAGSVEPQEILEDPHPVLGCDGLRVELDAPDGQRPVAKAHDLALGGLRGDLQVPGEGRALDEERMVAGAREPLRQALEQVGVAVGDRR